MKKVNSDKIDKNCVSLWPSTKLFTAQCRSTDQGLGIPAVEYLYFSVLIFFYNPWMCVQTKYICFSLFVNNFTSCLQWFAICPQWHHLSDPPNCRLCNPQWTFIYPLFSSTLTVFYYTRPRKYISRDEQTDSPPCLPHPFLTPHCPPPLLGLSENNILQCFIFQANITCRINWWGGVRVCTRWMTTLLDS